MMVHELTVQELTGHHRRQIKLFIVISCIYSFSSARSQKMVNHNLWLTIVNHSAHLKIGLQKPKFAVAVSDEYTNKNDRLLLCTDHQSF